MVIDDTGSVEGIYAFIYCTKWRSGQVLPMPDSHMKDRATQLLIKYKSGVLVTQLALSSWVEIVIATQWVKRTGQGHKHFEDVHPDAEADRLLHLAHRLSRLHSRLLDHRPCQFLLFRRRPGPQHVRLSYN